MPSDQVNLHPKPYLSKHVQFSNRLHLSRSRSAYAQNPLMKFMLLVEERRTRIPECTIHEIRGKLDRRERFSLPNPMSIKK